jgi:hypothetical protein
MDYAKCQRLNESLNAHTRSRSDFGIPGVDSENHRDRGNENENEMQQRVGLDILVESVRIMTFRPERYPAGSCFSASLPTPDVVCGGVGSGVARAQQCGLRFPSHGDPVVNERGKRSAGSATQPTTSHVPT